MDEIPGPSRPGSTEAQRQAWPHLVSHLSKAGKTARLFELLEQRGFLAGQADFFGDFGRTREDVETFILPATLAAGDWNRFLRYATVTLHLRGLAEALTEPEILEALAQSGRLKLATDLAGRLAEPLERAAALSVIAQKCRSDPADFRQRLESLGQSLEAPLPPSSDPAEVVRRGGLLARMARLLGPDLTSSWPLWIAKAGLYQEEADPVWRAVAESWLDREETAEPALWEALRQIHHPQVLLDFLPEALGLRAAADPAEVLTRLSSLFQKEDQRSRAVLSFLSRLAGSRPDDACALWEKVSNESLSWTVELIETAGPLLARLDSERLEIQDPVTRAALRVVVLEATKDPLRADAALEAVESLPDGPEKLHYALRYLGARPSEPEDEVRGQVAAVARYLHEIRYGAAPDDLRRYLDRIAQFFPEELPFQVESLFTSPASHPDVLYALIRSAESTAVLFHMMENASRYASLAARNEAEAFRLRGEILNGAARRLCLLGESPCEVMEKVSQRLLLQEEDEIRSALVPLAAGFDGAAETIATGIRNGRRNLIARLRSRAFDPEKELQPSSLFEQVAQADALETELSGLKMLLGHPNDPEMFDRVPANRVDLFLRLGWHALSYEAKHFQTDWDPRAILSRIEPRLVIEDDESLVAWTPAVVALAAQPNDRRAVAEVVEGAEKIAGLEGVPWLVRRKALESLLASIPAVFVPLAGGSPSRTRRRAKAALSVLKHLPDRLHPGEARNEVADHKEEILALVDAAGQRLDRPGSGEDESPDLPAGKSPSDPGVEPLVRRLWKHSSNAMRKELAHRFQDSLAGGGRLQAEAALRWWLHGHLAPRRGELDEHGLGRACEAEDALSRARSLGADRQESP